VENAYLFLLWQGGSRKPPRLSDRGADRAEGDAPWAIKSLSDDIHSNVLENSCNRMYL
jgi:hypothetical protein